MTRAAKPPPSTAITLADFEQHCRRLRRLSATTLTRHVNTSGEFECDFMSGNERDRDSHVGFSLDPPKDTHEGDE